MTSVTRSVIRRVTAVLVAGAWVATAFPAGAVAPPVPDPGALGPAIALAAKGGPPEDTEQRSQCSEPFLIGGAPHDPPLAQRILNLTAAWQFSRGAGQKVAVIDTGVNRHPRLPNLQAGGDFVSGGDGTEDCDGHGTFVAGLIAAEPGPDDAYSGVAPDASILAIRELSLEYEAKNHAGEDLPGNVATGGFGTVLTMAAGIVKAVDLGATVINISEVSCTAVGDDTADAVLGAAIRYAADHDVVVVAAAGNLDQTHCAVQNDGTGWGAVKTVASPAWYSSSVLTVGSTDPTGTPSAFSIRGPWVGVAAPGTGMIALDSKPGGTGLVDAERGQNGPAALDGTSFSSALVSGVVALVRSRFPQLSARQVVDRIERTAQHPGTGRDDAVGYGLIDPVAALTGELPAVTAGPGADAPHAIAAPPVAARPDPLPRRIAGYGSIALLVLAAAGRLIAIPYRRRAPVSADPAADLPEGR